MSVCIGMRRNWSFSWHILRKGHSTQFEIFRDRICGGFVMWSMFIWICRRSVIKLRPFGGSFCRSLDVGRCHCIRRIGLYTQLCGSGLWAARIYSDVVVCVPWGGVLWGHEKAIVKNRRMRKGRQRWRCSRQVEYEGDLKWIDTVR